MSLVWSYALISVHEHEVLVTNVVKWRERRKKIDNRSDTEVTK